jgi:hypothetical protein
LHNLKLYIEPWIEIDSETNRVDDSMNNTLISDNAVSSYIGFTIKAIQGRQC